MMTKIPRRGSLVASKKAVKANGRYQHKAKTWLGKRLTSTENDGTWVFLSKADEPYQQLILQELSDGRWQALVRLGSISVHTESYKREYEARGEAERRLLWYRLQLARTLRRSSYTRATPPTRSTDI